MDSDSNEHVPVLIHEIMALLMTDNNGIYFDGTMGDGGYTRALLDRLGSKGAVIATDVDDRAVRYAEKWKDKYGYGEKISVHHANFSDMPHLLDNKSIQTLQGIVLDLGLSSRQLDTPERGFSYRSDGPLDMRMDNHSEQTACTIINSASEDDLKSLFFTYGEDRRSAFLAKIIVREREKRKIATTFELVEIMKKYWRPKHYPKSASRIFQALRITVNRELESLETFLGICWDYLVKGGRIAVVSYHSLEDRKVKTAFRQHENPCVCPKDFPECRCGRTADTKILTKRPIRPSEAEIAQNPRAKSAKLRVAEKI
jgi:16S rRNA (cytosine1402-N4)-methyltransferase